MGRKGERQEMSPAPKWKMLYFSFKGSWAWKICQLRALVMGISPFLQHEGWPCGPRPGSGWTDVRSLVHRCCGWDGNKEEAPETPREGASQGLVLGGRTRFRISIFLLLCCFLPSCLQGGPGANPADTYQRGSFSAAARSAMAFTC